MALRTLKLPLGSATERMTINQTQVDTLIKVFYDQNITTKQVSGYVYKSQLTARENYLLTQLGLNVAYEALVPDVWSMNTSTKIILSGESATINIEGLTVNDVVMTINTVTVEVGSITETQARACLTLSGGVLTFNQGNIQERIVLTVGISAYPVWDTEDVKTTSLNCGVIERKVWINPSGNSASLAHEGTTTVLDDYVQKCKCYVFSSDGSQKAEIASARFEGVYAGMSSGAVVFKDGTEVQLSVLNTAGCNFMVLRPALYVWCGTESGAEVLKASGTYDVLGAGKKLFPKKYIGMFKAFTQNGVLKSQPNRIPTGNQTITTFQSQALAGNPQGVAASNGYGLWNYTDWCKENALHIAYFANTNYEINVGTGRIGGNQTEYDRVRNIVTGFTLPFAGQYTCGTRATVNSAGAVVNCLNFFGIEGLGEQIWEFVIGFRHNGSTAYVWDANEWAENHAADRAFSLGVTSASNTYIKTIIAGENFDMLPRAVGASSTTGYCDGHWIDATNGRLLFVGGAADGGSVCGLAASYANLPFSYSNAHVGGRLAFWGEPTEVAGAQFVGGL